MRNPTLLYTVGVAIILLVPLIQLLPQSIVALSRYGSKKAWLVAALAAMALGPLLALMWAYVYAASQAVDPQWYVRYDMLGTWGHIMAIICAIICCCCACFCACILAVGSLICG